MTHRQRAEELIQHYVGLRKDEDAVTAIQEGTIDAMLAYAAEREAAYVPLVRRDPDGRRGYMQGYEAGQRAAYARAAEMARGEEEAARAMHRSCLAQCRYDLAREWQARMAGAKWLADSLAAPGEKEKPGTTEPSAGTQGHGSINVQPRQQAGDAPSGAEADQGSPPMTRDELLALLSGYDVRDTQPVEVPPRVLAEAAAMLAADAGQIVSGERLAREVQAFHQWLDAAADQLDEAIGAKAEASQGSMALTAASVKLAEMIAGPDESDEPTAEQYLARLKERMAAAAKAARDLLGTEEGKNA